MQLRSALPLFAITLLSACTVHPWARQDEVEVDWFKSGSYVGLKLGRAKLDASSSSFESDLAGRGHTTSIDLDTGDSASDLYVGFRFKGPYAVELGYVNLGEAESSILPVATNPATFLGDVASLQPFLGRGVRATGSYIFLDEDRVELSIKGGLWYWEADVEVEPAIGQTVDINENGIDITLGIQALIGLTDNFDLLLGWDRYYIDGTDADAFWIGIQGSLY